MLAILCESFHGYSAMKIAKVLNPTLRPGCVRIEVHYATVGFGVALVVAGKYQRSPPLPFTPGTEIAGVVTEISKDVNDFCVGDKVAAIVDWGGFAQEVISSIETVWHVPSGLDLSIACTVPATFGTAYASLHWRAQIQAKENVLIFGASGGVGLAAIQLARLAGTHVIAAARTQERLEVALAYGANEGLLNDTPDLGRLLKQRNGGRGIDLVFDPVGGAMFDHAIRCTAPEGRILCVGFASSQIPQIPANLLLIKNIQVIGINFGLYCGWTPLDERKLHAPKLKEMVQFLFLKLVAGQIKPISSMIFRLEDFKLAFDSIIKRNSIGRVVLKIQN